MPAENAVSVVCQLIDVRMDCVDLLKDRTAHHANAVVAARCEAHARTFSAAEDTCDALGNAAPLVIQSIQRTDNTPFAKVAKRVRGEPNIGCVWMICFVDEAHETADAIAR
jgi:hypothetical protein